MAEPTHSTTVKLSDPVTICLQGALQRLRQARVLAEEQGDSPQRRLLISTAWVAVQDAIDGEPS